MFNYRAVAGVLVALVAVSAGCSQTSMDDAARNNPKSMTLSTSAVSLLPGATARITASFRNEFDDPTNVHPTLLWLSSNPAVATVQVEGANSDGVITAVSSGTATITATYGVLQESVAVTVTGVTSWVLDSVSGGSSLNVTQSGGTLNATIVFTPPAQVSVGENAVSATVNATVTSNPPPTPPPALDWIVGARLTDVTVDASAAPLAIGNTHLNANPTATETITATGTWTIPASYQSRQTLRLRAFGVAPIGTFPNRDAYYHKAGQ